MMDWLWYQHSLVSDLAMTPASCEVWLPPGARVMLSSISQSEASIQSTDQSEARVMLSSLGDRPGPVAAREEIILARCF